MEILQLRILSYEEVKKDVTSVSTKVNELWTTIRRNGIYESKAYVLLSENVGRIRKNYERCRTRKRTVKIIELQS